MAAVENWVVHKAGVPVRLHFKDHALVDRTITDPTFRVPRTVKGLVFLVDLEDGRAVDKSYSVVSQRLSEELSGYLEGKRYRNYEFTLVKDAPGTVPPRIVSITPYP